MSGFGNVEGASEGPDGFIRFAQRWGGISFSPDDRRTRIIVGRRGSGKSRFMRAMELEVCRDDGKRMLVFPQKDERLWVSEVRWLHRTYKEPFERLDIWRKLWGCAIYASLASSLVYFSPPTGTAINMKPDDRDYLKKFCADHLQKSTVANPIVAVMNRFLRRYQDRSRLDSFVSESFWIDLEDRVLRVMASSTPIACYIDTLDENYAASPAAATDCQVGLLHWILGKLNDPNISNRLHIVVAVRETIFATLMQGEHGPRYHRHSALRCLDWERGAAETFLKQKIRALPTSSRLGPSNSEEVLSWLGMDSLRNPARNGHAENISDLILRHTRFLPREIVEIGNRLDDYVRQRVARREKVTETGILEIILDEASIVAERAIETAVDHMIALDGDHDRTVISNGFREKIVHAIHSNFIPALEAERVSRIKLLDADAQFKAAMDDWTPKSDWREVPLSEIFWLHGLLGFEAQSDPRPIVKYFGSTRTLESHLSRELPVVDHYFLHSALLKPTKIRTSQTPPHAETADG